MGLERPDIVIAGAGGMGALFGAILQEGGLRVTLFDSNAEHVEAISKNGLSITGFGGDRVVKIDATMNAADIEKADAILFQCKAHGTAQAARAVRHLVDGSTVCVSFQNGLGNEEAIAQEVGKENVLGGLTAMAGMMLGPGEVRDFSRVPSYIGEMGGGDSGRAKSLAAALTTAGLETHASSNVVRDIWKKLLGNIAMSAVSGATNLTAAGCLAVPALKATSLAALDEALAVAAAYDITLDREETVAGMELISQAGGTGDNKSSLCVDLLNRRPTEVDFIYGSVIARARAKDIETPTLDTLSSIVKGLESHYLPVDGGE
ncbi:MAG: ketopantoate reductase family protein [Hyphomicrobiaceae bacterium]